MSHKFYNRLVKCNFFLNSLIVVLVQDGRGRQDYLPWWCDWLKKSEKIVSVPGNSGNLQKFFDFWQKIRKKYAEIHSGEHTSW